MRIRDISDALAHVLQHPGRGVAPPVTTRERDILMPIASGHSSQDIATRLNPSVLTVTRYRLPPRSQGDQTARARPPIDGYLPDSQYVHRLPTAIAG
ncbi:LuxR C-terminal-related transcriptional regulator [Burkholderia sp. Z1]|uniref:LuxR C-terminal-related transcriptional regulator n=1 Tax=Burkholderia sp. Z1 TaxID=2759039 RepID=UPI0039B0B4A4